MPSALSLDRAGSPVHRPTRRALARSARDAAGAALQRWVIAEAYVFALLLARLMSTAPGGRAGGGSSGTLEKVAVMAEEGVAAGSRPSAAPPARHEAAHGPWVSRHRLDPHRPGPRPLRADAEGRRRDYAVAAERVAIRKRVADVIGWDGCIVVLRRRRRSRRGSMPTWSSRHFLLRGLLHAWPASPAPRLPLPPARPQPAPACRSIGLPRTRPGLAALARSIGGDRWPGDGGWCSGLSGCSRIWPRSARTATVNIEERAPAAISIFLFAGLSAILLPSASTPIHVFVDEVDVVLQREHARDGSRPQHLQFDEAFSQYAVQGLDKRRGWQAQPRGMNSGRQGQCRVLEEFDFFTFLLVGVTHAAFTPPQEIVPGPDDGGSPSSRFP